MDAASIARELLPRLRRWTPDSWALPALPARADEPTLAGAGAPAGGGSAEPARAEAGDRPRTRAEVAAEVVQRIADLAADAEGQPRRTVPRLADVVLADQLAVLVDDALRTGSPDAGAAVARELAALRTALGYR